jgi:hypothetical protein
MSYGYLHFTVNPMEQRACNNEEIELYDWKIDPVNVYI